MESGVENPTPTPQKKKRFRETVGRVAAEVIIDPTVKSLRKRVKKFNIATRGQENLSSLPGSFLIAANHLQPTGHIYSQFELSPDAFVIEHEVEKALSRRPRIVAKSDDSWWARNAPYRKLQEKTHALRQVAMRDTNFIPVMMNPGSLNKTFVEEVNKAVAAGDPIIILPEGHWYEDFDTNHPLKNGTAIIALKHNLPIVPTYIKGAHQWRKGQKVELVFGKVIRPEGKERSQITEEIRENIAALQQTV
jgi:1-acyl-sn-glycerol-3-phosphate acyltransferase